MYEKRFAEYYDLIYKEIVNYEKDITVLEKIFAKFCTKRPKSILDIGCGTGSHAVILSKRGYDVAGIDISEKMVEQAKKKAKQEKVKTEFFVQDMRKISLGKSFDCAISMFGGFGYVLKYSDLIRVFSGLSRYIAKDGLFIFEFWNVGGLKPSPYQTWTKVQDLDATLYRLSESNFDPQTNVLAVDMHFILTHKDKLLETFSEVHKLRCYTLAELEHYLEGNGFKLVAAYDASGEDKMELKPPEKETFRILAVARKH